MAVAADDGSGLATIPPDLSVADLHRPRPRVTLVVEPRFPGGTSGAVAAEILALAPHVDLSVVGLQTRMFRDRALHPGIVQALEDVGLSLLPAPPVLRADVVVLHNPSALRFETSLGTRLSAARIVLVTHENFLRPGGAESFDVAHCLGLVAAGATGGECLLAPVSAGNRRLASLWLDAHPASGWALAADDWPNILDVTFQPPTSRPRDRRGRHSRPGFEKFPALAALGVQFPAHAERCVLLGADMLLADREGLPAHWELLPFGSEPVESFLAGIDVLVYFTSAHWRESFGRAIAEAIAAGKLVVTDAETAEPFGPGVLVAADGGTGGDADALVAAHVADPALYAATVRRAQSDLARYRPEAVVPRLLSLLATGTARHASV